MKLRYCAMGVAALSAGMLFSISEHAAAQTASAQAMLEEVVVTARRREESLQDLPLSVAALSADTMQAQGIIGLEDITEHIPNLVLTTQDRRGIQALYIRGIGSGSTNNLVPVGAGVYIDGHYMPNTLGQMMSTLDVERIEVMRGPQGTLFGKNTTGGAINIITTKPGPEFEANAMVRAADYGQADFRGTINVPFSDTVAGRLSVSKETSDGYYWNRTQNRHVGATDITAFAGALRLTPNDNWIVDLHLRENRQRDDNASSQCEPRPTQQQVDRLWHNGEPVSTMVYDAAGNLTEYVHEGYRWDGPVYAAVGHNDQGGIGQWGGSIGRPGINVGGHLERLYPGATIDYWESCLADIEMGDFVTSYEKDTFVNLDNTTYGASFQWDSGGAYGALENLNVKLNVSRHEVDYDYLQDRDFSAIKVDAIGTPPRGGFGQQQANSQIELLFTADVSDRLAVVAGVHLFEDEWHVGAGDCLGKANANIDAIADPDSALNQSGGIECFADGGTQFDRLADRLVAGRSTSNARLLDTYGFEPRGPGVAGMSGFVGTESQAIFAHATYDLTDRWQMDIGVRTTTDTRTFNQAEVDVPGHLCTHRNPGDPAENQQCVPTYTINFRNLLDRGFYNNTSREFSEVTPMLSFTRLLENDNMVYFRYAEGFLSGSFNDELNATLVPELTPLLSYEPEHVYNYEVGFKGRLADGRVSIAGAVFFMDYQDKQESISIDNSDGRYGGDPNVSIRTNAAEVAISGIELEVRAVPWDNGFWSLDLGRLTNEYSDFSAFNPDNPGVLDDLSDVTISDLSPEWTINTTIEHQFGLGNGATVTPQLGMYWQSEYDFFRGFDGWDQASGNSYCYQEPYAKFRARATYEPADGAWQASVFGQNITDTRYYERCNRQRRSGVHDYRYGRPVTWGAEFIYRFGG